MRANPPCAWLEQLLAGLTERPNTTLTIIVFRIVYMYVVVGVSVCVVTGDDMFEMVGEK